MYKRLVSILTSLVIIMSFNVCVFAEEQAQIVVSSATIEQGNSNVDITIAIKNNPGIVSAKMTLEFDDNVLTLTKVTDKGVLGATYHSPSLENPYNLYWNNGSATENFTYNGEIVKLTFSINPNASVGTYPIYVSYDEDNILNTDMENVFFNTVNGSVNISKPSGETNNSMVVSGISFGVSLSGDTSVGSVYAGLYDKNGTLKACKLYKAADTVNVSFDVGATGSYAKIMWWNDNMQPMCEAQIIPLQ